MPPVVTTRRRNRRLKAGNSLKTSGYVAPSRYLCHLEQAKKKSIYSTCCKYPCASINMSQLLPGDHIMTSHIRYELGDSIYYPRSLFWQTPYCAALSAQRRTTSLTSGLAVCWPLSASTRIDRDSRASFMVFRMK